MILSMFCLAVYGALAYFFSWAFGIDIYQASSMVALGLATSNFATSIEPKRRNF